MRALRTGPTRAGSLDEYTAISRVWPPSTCSTYTMSAERTPVCGSAFRVFSIFTASTGLSTPRRPPVKGWVAGAVVVDAPACGAAALGGMAGSGPALEQDARAHPRTRAPTPAPTRPGVPWPRSGDRTLRTLYPPLADGPEGSEYGRELCPGSTPLTGLVGVTGEGAFGYPPVDSPIAP
ncbi:hypothetical protein Acsp03_43390 [Actinomadura sp. NBRC 104412]|nr:hypothetical protein Acsp03_43390 [Actinomadura sp. NBRC 104412]